MELNVTIFAQMVVFAALIWFTMKFVWPIVMGAMSEREQRIAEGLRAAEEGLQAQQQAQSEVAELLKQARLDASELITRAEQQAAETVEQAKNAATEEAERVMAAAEERISVEVARAREQLRQEVASLVVTGAEQILRKEVDAGVHERLLQDLVAKL